MRTGRQEIPGLVEGQLKPRYSVSTHTWRVVEPVSPPWLLYRLLEEAFRLGLLRLRQLGEEMTSECLASSPKSAAFWLLELWQVMQPILSLSFFFFQMGLIMAQAGVAQWIGRWPTNLEVTGSVPG